MFLIIAIYHTSLFIKNNIFLIVVRSFRGKYKRMEKVAFERKLSQLLH